MFDYKVKLDVFQGPLDLLLYLIKELEIDIYDIPMKVLSKQYMDYIASMKALEINVASEYLVMASELLKIKSKMLLPEPPISDEGDPRDELVGQLLEYQNYKAYAESLESLMASQSKIMTKAPQEMQEIDIASSTLNVDIQDLIHAFNKMEQRIKMKEEASFVIHRDTMSHEEASDYLNRQFNYKHQMSLHEVFETLEGRHRIVTVFIVVLEHIKNHVITIGRRDDDTIDLERPA